MSDPTIPFKYPEQAELVHKSKILTDGRVRKHFDPDKLDALAVSIAAYGLLNPPVLDKRGTLIGGERRFRAITENLGSEYVPIIRLAVSKADRLELELDENLRRADFTWQETAIGVYNLHQYKVKQKLKLGQEWRQIDTGTLLNLKSRTHVAHCLKVAKHLIDGDTEIHSCPNLANAVEVLLRRAEQAASEEATKRLGSRHRKPATPVIPASIAGLTIASTTKSGSLGMLDDLDQAQEKPAPVSNSVIMPANTGAPYRFPLFERLLRETDQDMGPKSVMATLEPESFDHIVCDPPYAIKVDQMGLKNVSEIEDTHDVKQNVELLKRFIPLAYKALKPNGFLVFWYDNIHWEYLFKLATKAGFAVQRWPLVWCKAHQCRNQAANQNYTKATEFAMVCRKGVAALSSKANKNFFTSDGSVERKLYSNPFAKPQDAWAFILNHIAHQGQSILDPFMGQGSSIRAMINLGFNPTGIEVDEHHYNKCVSDIAGLLKELHGNNVILE